MKNLISSFFILGTLAILTSAPTEGYASTGSRNVDIAQFFSDRDACFMVSELESGRTITEFNTKRCRERFSPCSSFKVAAALMAFEKDVFKDENHVVKWDGIERTRAEENRNQTPKTFMQNSIKWVTEWMMPQLGEKTIQSFLNSFEYGNKDFSGGLKSAWVTSSLKISALEQKSFLTRLWKNELPLKQRSMLLAKQTMFIQNIESAQLFGKTGTGCLGGHSCMSRPDKMLGWFVGALATDASVYIVVANSSDLKDQDTPAGPRLRNTSIALLQKLGLARRHQSSPPPGLLAEEAK